MHLVILVIFAFLSSALSKSHEEHAPRNLRSSRTNLEERSHEAPRNLSEIIEKPSSTSGSTKRNLQSSDALPEHREASFTNVEAHLVPEEPDRYAELVNYVRKLLEEETGDTDVFHEEPSIPWDSAKERKKQETTVESKFEDVGRIDGKFGVNVTSEGRRAQRVDEESEEVDTGRVEVSTESSKKSASKFDEEEAEKARKNATKNSSNVEISRDEEKYLSGRKADRTNQTTEESPKLRTEEINESETRTDGGGTEPEEEDLLEAAHFGLRAMHELYYVKEPKLYSMGLYLDTDNPARYVAAFNDQTEEARALAKYGFAVLQSTSMFVKKFPDTPKELILSRRSQNNPLQRNCPSRGIPDCPPASLRYRTSDGSCNNLQHLWWGSAMSTMERFLPPVYHDGVQSIRRSASGRPLPSAREISNVLHEDRDVPLASVTHMLMQWGQFVDHDLTATGQSRGFNGTVPQCCLGAGVGFQPPEFMHPECLPIAVTLQDSFFAPLGVRCLEFLRSGSAPREDCKFGPREQLSQVTSYLDASTVYSSNAFQSDTLRLFRNGLLQYGRIQSRRPLLPKRDSDLCKRGSLSTSCFRAGDGRLSEQPALTSLHVVFLRLHNRIATKLAALNFHWSDEKLFQETRRIVGAIVQHVTYREFLPIVLGQEVMRIFDLEVLKKGYYEGYDPTINPTVANGFSTAAYRFGHSLVQHSFVRFDGLHKPIFNNVSIHDEFSNPVNLETAGSVDRLLLGLVNQPSQRRDEFITEELTNHLFQTPRFPFGMDLASLNIQRGRDHGIPPYVQWREPCGLSPIKSFDDLNRVMPSASIRKFKLLYSTVDDIDLYPAGLAENSVSGGLVGPTFACIIAQQFGNLRRGDRFWYENPERENGFTPGQLQQIRRVTLAQILCRTMDNIETIQPFVFLTHDTFKNQRLSCKDPTIGELDLDFWAERPPESRGNEESLEKANRKVPDRKNPPRPSNYHDNPKVEVKTTESKFIPQRQKPTKASINQQNRIIVRRPIGPPDNLTIVVQNNAVNSPVFVNDAIYGSHVRVHPTMHSQTTQRPAYNFVGQDTVQFGQGFPVYGPPVKPIPTTIPGLQAGRPYVPHGFEDPSNPNPLAHGFQSASRFPTDVLFESFSMTSPRPTLYTYYTNVQQRPSTQRPVYPIDSYLVNYRPTMSHVGPSGTSYPWPNVEPNYSLTGVPQVEDTIKSQNGEKVQQYGSMAQENSGGWQNYQYRPSRPYNQADNLEYNREKPGVKPNRNDYGTRPSVSSYQIGVVDPSGQHDSVATGDDRVYQTGPSKRPVMADSDGWSTIPTYQKESVGRPSSYHDTASSISPFQAGTTGRPGSSGGSFPSHEKRPTITPVVIQNDKYPTQSSRPDFPSYTKNPPESSTVSSSDFDEFENAPSYQKPISSTSGAYDNWSNAQFDRGHSKDPYQRPTSRPFIHNDKVDLHSYSSNPVKRPGISEDDFENNQYYKKPTNRPFSAQTDKLSSPPYQSTIRPQFQYSQSPGADFQSFKTEGYSNIKPTKVHSVTIVTESIETSSSQPAYFSDRTQNVVTSEIPRPLLSHAKNDKIGIRRPGQYYYEKNVLHRYPDKLEDQTPGYEVRSTKDDHEEIEERERTIPDVGTTVKSVTDDSRINSQAIDESEPRAGKNGEDGTTEATIKSDHSDKDDSDVYDLEGAFSEDVERAALPDRTHHWLNPQEDSKLPSTLEMPTVRSEEIPAAKELPRPIKFRSHAS